MDKCDRAAADRDCGPRVQRAQSAHSPHKQIGSSHAIMVRRGSIRVLCVKSAKYKNAHSSFEGIFLSLLLSSTRFFSFLQRSTLRRRVYTRSPLRHRSTRSTHTPLCTFERSHQHFFAPQFCKPSQRMLFRPKKMSVAKFFAELLSHLILSATFGFVGRFGRIAFVRL